MGQNIGNIVKIGKFVKVKRRGQSVGRSTRPKILLCGGMFNGQS